MLGPPRAEYINYYNSHYQCQELEPNLDFLQCFCCFGVLLAQDMANIDSCRGFQTTLSLDMP
jgi:hypothetical protein